MARNSAAESVACAIGVAVGRLRLTFCTFWAESRHSSISTVRSNSPSVASSTFSSVTAR